jgi:hypothetical protein
MARANEAKKQKTTSTSAAPPPVCPVFVDSVSRKTTARKTKKAMPAGVMRKQAGRPKGISDSAARKTRDVSPVKVIGKSSERKRPAHLPFTFPAAHQLRVDRRTDGYVGDPRWDQRKDGREDTHACRDLIPSICAPTHEEAELVSRFVHALTHKSEGKPGNLEAACAAILSAVPVKPTV